MSQLRARLLLRVACEATRSAFCRAVAALWDHSVWRVIKGADRMPKVQQVFAIGDEGCARADEGADIVNALIIHQPSGDGVGQADIKQLGKGAVGFRMLDAAQLLMCPAAKQLGQMAGGIHAVKAGAQGIVSG